LLIKKVGKAKPWQAAAWMLERKFGAEFGRRDKHEIRGELKHGASNELIKKIISDPETARLADDLADRLAIQSGINGAASN